MPRRAHVGSRLRERRQMLALKQSQLAKEVGISPAYLNLIEHNRRRIGGKLLVDLSRALDVDPSVLSQGAETRLVEALHAAAGARGALSEPEPAGPPPEGERAEEFAERFPGWAGLVGAQAARIDTLERTVEALTDRLTHDPFLSASLHDVLSVVTAIRSTAGILASGEAVDPEWQARFHRNLYEDSQRLATSSQALVSYLDEEIEAAGTGSNAAPQDEVEAWLSGTGFHMAELEGEGAETRMDALVGEARALSSAPARQLAQGWMQRYVRDAARMPLDQIEAVLAEHGPDPARVAHSFGVSLPAAMRRMGALPPRKGEGPRFGVVICDGSGTLTFREPLNGFALPRFGAACPLWPLYQALVRPGTPVRAVVDMPGPSGLRFTCYAYCQTRGRQDFAMPPVLEATMLIVDGGPEGEAATPIGTSCRICPREGCAARREPSILAAGL